MSRGSFAVGVPMLWALGGVAILVLAEVESIAVSAVMANSQLLHDTYYVVLHRGYAIVLAAAFGVFAGWYYLFPKVIGWSYSSLLGKIHFWLTFIGIGAGAVPLILALAYVQPDKADVPDPFRYVNLASRIGGYVAAAGTVVFFINMALAFWRRQPAS
jgi:cytochrome c oxidase subunit 1